MAILNLKLNINPFPLVSGIRKDRGLLFEPQSASGIFLFMRRGDMIHDLELLEKPVNETLDILCVVRSALIPCEEQTLIDEEVQSTITGSYSLLGNAILNLEKIRGDLLSIPSSKTNLKKG